MNKKKKKAKPFWNRNTKKISDRLWIPSINNQINQNIFDYNFNCQSFDFSYQTNSNNVNNNFQLKQAIINQDNIMKAKKIQLFFTNKQKMKIKKFIDIYRFVYNRILSYVKKKNPRIHKYNFYYLRKTIKSNLPKWTFEMPSHYIDQAINDVCKAYKTAFKLKEKGFITHFNLKFKSRRNPKQTICIENCYFSNKCNSFSPTILGDFIKTNVHRNFLKKVNKSCRLVYYKNSNKYYLYVPKEVVVINNNKKFEIASLDPGIRTFQTLFSFDHISEIGKNNQDKLIKLQKEKDILLSRKFRGKKRRKKYDRAIFNKQKRITNLVDELHWKTCNYLCNNYKRIIIPEINVQEIVRKDKNLNKISKRAMLALRHYEFRKRLEYKCKQKGCQLIIVDEDYTSKTCGKCGFIKDNLGSSKIFKCDKCKVIIDRDVNGARNIFLKNYKEVLVR